MPIVNLANMPAKRSYDIVVSGAGPTGLTSAFAIRNQVTTANGARPTILVAEKRGETPTRFQVFQVGAQTVDKLREFGLGEMFDGKTAVSAGDGTWAVPVKWYEQHLRAAAAKPDSGIDVLYDTAVTGVQQAKSGVGEIFQLAPAPSRPSAGSTQAAAGATKLRAGGDTRSVLARLGVVAEGDGSSTSKLFGIPRLVDELNAPMAVAKFARDEQWVAKNGANRTQKLLLRDPDGRERSLIVIDHERYGTTGMLQVPAGTPKEALGDVLIAHMRTAGFTNPRLEEGPTAFTAQGTVAERAIVGTDRRVVFVGDHNGTTTPNSGSNFGRDVTIDVARLLPLAQSILGSRELSPAQQAAALSEFDIAVIEGHQQSMLSGRKHFAGTPGMSRVGYTTVAAPVLAASTAEPPADAAASASSRS